MPWRHTSGWKRYGVGRTGAESQSHYNWVVEHPDPISFAGELLPQMKITLFVGGLARERRGMRIALRDITRMREQVNLVLSRKYGGCDVIAIVMRGRRRNGQYVACIVCVRHRRVKETDGELCSSAGAGRAGRRRRDVSRRGLLDCFN